MTAEAQVKEDELRDQQMLMQVSAAEGRLLVVATKGGANLGDPDQKELEDLVTDALRKADGRGGTASPTRTSTNGSTGTSSPDDSASPTVTDTEDNWTSSPTPTVSP